MIDETQREYSLEEELIYHTGMLEINLELSRLLKNTIRQLAAQAPSLMSPPTTDALLFYEQLVRVEGIIKELQEKIAKAQRNES